MKISPTKLRFDNFLLFLIFILAIGLLMLQSSPLTTLPGRDSGFFMYAGHQILTGKLPYIDFWDSKGPGIFYINALGLFLGHGSRWGAWLLEFILLVISAYLFYQGVAKKWGHGAALFSSIAWIYGFSRVWEGGNLTEEYTLFFSFILLSYFLQENKTTNKNFYLLTGTVFALNFLFRANNTGVPIAILLSLFILALWQHQYQRLSNIFIFTGISSFFVLGVVSLYFLSKGNFNEMVQAAILYNFFYANTGEKFQLVFWRGINQIGWPAYIAIIGYSAIIYQIFKKKFSKESTVIILFLLIDFPLEVILSSLSGKAYIHYFISWIPAIAILVAFTYFTFSKILFPTQLVDFLNQPKKSLSIAFGVLLLFYWITGTGKTYQNLGKQILFNRNQSIEKTDPVANFLKENTSPNDFVWIWGAYPSLNFLAQREAPTPYLFYPAYEPSPYLEEMSFSFWKDISTTPPKMIVDAYSSSPDYILSLDKENRQSQLQHASPDLYTPPYQNNFFDFVEHNYQHISTINGFDIYALIP